jgi:hypothetical protein
MYVTQLFIYAKKKKKGGGEGRNKIPTFQLEIFAHHRRADKWSFQHNQAVFLNLLYEVPL